MRRLPSTSTSIALLLTATWLAALETDRGNAGGRLATVTSHGQEVVVYAPAAVLDGTVTAPPQIRVYAPGGQPALLRFAPLTQTFSAVALGLPGTVADGDAASPAAEAAADAAFPDLGRDPHLAVAVVIGNAADVALARIAADPGAWTALVVVDDLPGPPPAGASHLALALLGTGRAPDWDLEGAQATLAAWRAAGCAVRHHWTAARKPGWPRDHSLERLIGWALWHGRLSHPGLDDATRANWLATAGAHITADLAHKDPLQVEQRLAEWMHLPLDEAPDFPLWRKRWLQVTTRMAGIHGDRTAFIRLLFDLTNGPLSHRLLGGEKAQLAVELNQLIHREPTGRWWSHRRAVDALAERELAAGRDREALAEVARAYRELAADEQGHDGHRARATREAERIERWLKH